MNSSVIREFSSCIPCILTARISSEYHMFTSYLFSRPQESVRSRSLWKKVKRRVAFRCTYPTSCIRCARSFPRTNPSRSIIRLFQVVMTGLIPPINGNIKRVHCLIRNDYPSRAGRSTGGPLESITSLGDPGARRPRPSVST